MDIIRTAALAALLAAGPAVAQSVSISGSVRDTQSAGVADAVVSVLRIDSPLGGGSVVATTTTDAQGSYALTVSGGCGLQCRVSVAAAGRVVAPNWRIVGASSSGQDFIAALPATINVRVETFEGATPVPGLRPFIAFRDLTPAPQVVDLGNGAWRFEQVFPGPLHLCAQSDDDAYVGTCQGDQVMPFTSRLEGLPEMLPAEGTTQAVVLRLRIGATLTGILTDAYRAAPIASAPLQMALFDFPGTATRTLQTHTDAQGRYRIAGLPQGGYRLQVSVRTPYYTPMRYPGLECVRLEDCLPNSGSYVSVSGTAVVDNLGFELTPGAVLTGRVSDATTGAPLPGIEVRAYQPRAFLGASRVASATTGADGRYAVANIPLDFATQLGTANTAGYIDVGWPAAPCDAPECTGGTAIAVQSGVASAAYDFTLASGRAIGGTLDMAGAAPGALQGTVTIFRQDGTQLSALWSGPVATGQSFVTRGFPAGTYFALARLGNACQVHALQACTLVLTPNPTTATPIVLPAALGIFPGVDFNFPSDALFGNSFEP